MDRNRDGELETIVGAAGVLTAGGVLTFAFFPFLLPMLVLLGVLALPLIPLALIAAVLAPIFLLARMGIRALRRDRRRGEREPAAAASPAPTTRSVAT